MWNANSFFVSVFVKIPTTVCYDIAMFSSIPLNLVIEISKHVYVCHGEASNLVEFEVPPGKIKIGNSLSTIFNWSFP